VGNVGGLDVDVYEDRCSSSASKTRMVGHSANSLNVIYFLSICLFRINCVDWLGQAHLSVNELFLFLYCYTIVSKRIIVLHGYRIGVSSPVSHISYFFCNIVLHLSINKHTVFENQRTSKEYRTFTKQQRRLLRQSTSTNLFRTIPIEMNNWRYAHSRSGFS